MRLFIAIRLSDEMTSELCRIQQKMRNLGITGRYSPPDNLHLTLAFIGDHDDPEIVMNAISEAVFTPFEICLGRNGCFGNICWTGICRNARLVRLVKDIRGTLRRNGIPFDGKDFRPHITLLRKASDTETAGKIKTVPVSMTADRISLMKSDFTADGVRYTEIGTVRAAKPA